MDGLQNNHRFNNTNKYDLYSKSKHTQNQTFIDGLYHSFNHNQKFIKSTQRILIDDEEYDTDSLEMDMECYQKNGTCNIYQLMKNKQNFDAIYDYIYDQNC